MVKLINRKKILFFYFSGFASAFLLPKEKFINLMFMYYNYLERNTEITENGYYMSILV